MTIVFDISHTNYQSGQGILAALAAVGGAKPLWDTFHMMTGRNPQGQLHADLALATTRFITVVMDSL